MRRIGFIAVLLAFLLVFSVRPVKADDGAEKPKGSISVLGRYVDDDDSMTEIGEYEERWSGVESEVNFDYKTFKFEGFFKDDDDWGGKFRFDAKRIFQMKGDVNRMFHYMGHEVPFPEGYPNYTDGFSFHDSQRNWWSPTYDYVIANEHNVFEYYVGPDHGATGAGHKMVRYTDLNVGKDYYMRITRYATSGTFHVPALPGLKLFYDFHRYEKSGHKQEYYMGGKCATCHIYTYGREIDERTNTFKAGFRLTRKLWGLEYYHEWKDFEDEAKPHSFSPDKVHHPANENANPFKGEVLYDENNLLSANTTPDVEKGTHVVKFYLKGLPLYSKLVMSYVHSHIKSEHDDDALPDLMSSGGNYDGYLTFKKTKKEARLPDLMSSGGNYDEEREDLTPNFDAFFISLTSRPLKNLTVNARYRYYSIDADNTDVTLYPVDPSRSWPVCGGHGGDPYPYENPAYYTYRSDYVLDRDVNEFRFALSYIFSQKYTLSFGWEREDIDRDSKQMNSQNPLDPSFPDAPYTESYDDTTTDSFFVNLNGRPFDKLSFKFSFRYDNTDDPFEFEKAKYPSNVTEYTTYDTWQYYRKLVGSADPEDSYTWKLSLNFTPTKSLILGFNGRYSDQDNDDADWDKDILSLGANLNFQPTEKLTFNLGYEYQKVETKTPAVVPIFDG